MAATATERMTVSQFEAVCQQIGPCELVRGEVVTLSPAGYRHGRACSNVAFLLSQWAHQTKRGRVLAGETGLVVQTQPDTVRGADVVYYSYARLPQGTQDSGFPATPPELVVEIVGKGQGWREMVEKAGEYLRMGVDRVWVIDPKSRRVHVFRPDAEPAVFSEVDPLIDQAILPGFACTVGEFFED